MRKIFYIIGIGIVIAIIVAAPIVAGLSVFLSWVMHVSSGIKWDDTDDQENRKSSGLMVMTDHKTGIQYLSTPFGGLTPRIDTDGKPMVAEKE